MLGQLQKQIIKELNVLPYEDQKKVLNFTQSLALAIPKGVAGKHLQKFAGSFSKKDLKIMAETIEAGCEQIDLNEW